MFDLQCADPQSNLNPSCSKMQKRARRTVHIHSDVSQNGVTFEIELKLQYQNFLKSEISQSKLGIRALIWCIFQFKVDEIGGTIDQKMNNSKALIHHGDFV